MGSRRLVLASLCGRGLAGEKTVGGAVPVKTGGVWELGSDLSRRRALGSRHKCS